VLGRFSKEERPAVLEALGWTVDALRCWLDEGIEKCMTRYNRRPDAPETGTGPAKGS
jgi:hypothetical protein